MDAPVTVCSACGTSVWIERPYRTTGHFPDGDGGWIEYELPPSAFHDWVCKTCWEREHGRPRTIWRDGVDVTKPFSPTGWP